MAIKKTSKKLPSRQGLIAVVVLLLTLIVGGFYLLSTYQTNKSKNQYQENYGSKPNANITEKQVPSEFPKDFPVPSNANLVSSWTNTDKTNLGISVIWTSTESSDNLVSFYKSELEKNGYKIVTEFANKPSYVISFSKAKMSGYIGIAQSQETTISVTIGFNN